MSKEDNGFDLNKFNEDWEAEKAAHDKWLDEAGKRTAEEKAAKEERGRDVPEEPSGEEPTKEKVNTITELQLEATELSRLIEAKVKDEKADPRSVEELTREHSKLLVRIIEAKNKAPKEKDLKEKRTDFGTVEELRKKLSSEVKTINLKEKETEIKETLNYLIDENKIVIPGFMSGKNRELLENFVCEELASRRVAVLDDGEGAFEKQFALEAVIRDVTTFMHERSMYLSRKHSSDTMSELSSWEGRSIGQRLRGLFSKKTAGKFAKMGVRHSGEEYYHQKQASQIFTAMLENKNAFLNYKFDKDKVVAEEDQDPAKHESYMDLIFSKNILVGEEGTRVINASINELAVSFVNGRITQEDFESKRDELFSSSEIRKEWLSHCTENGIKDENLAQAFDHIAKMQMLDLDMLISLAKEKTSVNTQLDKSWSENLIIKVQSNKALRWINPATIAIFGSVAAFAAKRAGNKSAAALTGGLTLALIGTYSYTRRSKEVKSDIQLHERQKAFGETLNNAYAPRREKMEEFSTDKISAKQLSEELQKLIENGVDERNHNQVLDFIGQIKFRQNLGKENDRDFFVYSNEESVLLEKAALSLAVSIAMEKALDFVFDQQKIGKINPKINVYDYFKDQLSERIINRSLQEDFEEKEKASEKFRKSESLKAAGTAVAIGGSILSASLAFQEAFAYKGSSVSEPSTEIKLSSDLKIVEIPNSDNEIQVSEDSELIPNNGSYDLVEKNGKVIASGLNIENGQITNPEQLEEKGFKVETKTTTETKSVPFEEAVNGERINGIERDWHDYGTDSPITEGNENKLYINSKSGGSIVDVSGMFKDSADFENSELAGLKTDGKFNNLYALITPTGAEDQNPIAVPIGPDGKLDIDKNSPLSHFFEGKEFTGRHLEIAYKNPNSNSWDILATVNGEGIVAPENVEVSTETIETTVIPPEESPTSPEKIPEKPENGAGSVDPESPDKKGEYNIPEQDESLAPFPIISEAPRKPLEKMEKEGTEEAEIHDNNEDMEEFVAGDQDTAVTDSGGVATAEAVSKEPDKQPEKRKAKEGPKTEREKETKKGKQINIDTKYIEQAIASGEELVTVMNRGSVGKLSPLEKIRLNTFWGWVLNGATEESARQKAQEAENAFKAGKSIPEIAIRKVETSTSAKKPEQPKPSEYAKNKNDLSRKDRVLKGTREIIEILNGEKNRAGMTTTLRSALDTALNELKIIKRDKNKKLVPTTGFPDAGRLFLDSLNESELEASNLIEKKPRATTTEPKPASPAKSQKNSEKPKPSAPALSEVLMETALEVGNSFGSGRNQAIITEINEQEGLVKFDSPITVTINKESVTNEEFEIKDILRVDSFKRIGIVQDYLKANKEE